ncbi:MAG: hypothetical protein OEZ02_07150 [Anaerolineae bacterium]|nr:hypothetical protein [Anaerolineae bacterium]
MSLRKLVIWVTFLGVFAMASRVAVDTDSWWHLATGQWIVEHGSVPKVDPFSHTQTGTSWQGPSVGWLMQTALYLVFQAAGFGGLNLMMAVMITAAFGFVYRSLSGGVFLRAFVTILAVATSGVYWAARPYLMTFLLTAVSLWIFEDFRWGRKDRLGWLPVIMLVWSNSHGGFAVGFILWGLYGLGEGVTWLAELQQGENPSVWKFTREWLQKGLKDKVGRMLLVGVGMLVFASFNFSGPGILLYPFQTVSIGALQDFIQEWQSPNFHDLQMQPFAWLLLLTLGALGISKERIALTDFLLVTVFGYMGLMAGRNVALFALAAPVVLTRHAGPVLQAVSLKMGFRPLALNEARIPKMQNALNWSLVGILAMALSVQMASTFPEAVNWKVISTQSPVDAVSYLHSERPNGKMFNSYNWGGYLIWALPEYPVFVDGRTDLYAGGTLDEWLGVVQAEPGWQSILADHGINVILVEPYWPVVRFLDAEGWQLIYADNAAVIYAR